jgi:hypothetical protein
MPVFSDMGGKAQIVDDQVLAEEEALKEAIKKIHDRFFTRECPFCAEIIKKRAKICKHCQKEVI